MRGNSVSKKYRSHIGEEGKTMDNLILKFKIESFRKIPNPYVNKEEGNKNAEMYVAIVDVKELPDNFPMGTNPREQNLKKMVPRKIKETLLSPDELDFFLLNRGLLLSVKSAVFNNYSNELSLEFTDLDVHGNIDGGHTYKVILENRDQLEFGRQFVKLEILTNIEDIFERLAAARNTSVQVKDESIAELEKRFDPLKKVIAKEPFARRVSYKENEEGDIDITDILTILNMFNIDRYNKLKDFPINSYNSKKTCIDLYIAENKKEEETGNKRSNPYYKMEPIMIKIFKLYDKIEKNIGDYYREANKGGKYGSVKGVGMPKSNKPLFTKFYNEKMSYNSPKGFIYPILGAFRALVYENENGQYDWKADPLAVLDNAGPMLVDGTVELSRALGNNPNAVGKNLSNWRNLYMTVLLFRGNDNEN